MGLRLRAVGVCAGGERDVSGAGGGSGDGCTHVVYCRGHGEGGA